MAGLSARFAQAGYTLPKYQLPLEGRSVFRHVVEGFAACFGEHPFLFVLRDVHGAAGFVRAELAAIPGIRAEVVALSEPTQGQAETVALGLEGARDVSSGPLVIFNIDTIRPRFALPPWAGDCDGFLEVFRGEGEHWSFVEPVAAGSSRVARTTEKERISDLCCTGLYGFRSAELYLQYYRRAKAAGLTVRGELYVAPVYNLLIADGLDVRWYEIGDDDVRFCGTPAEYLALGGLPPESEVG